jgi:predicted RNA-binding Zn-ribbon protein involved in translation (DUF1610 family)
MFRFLIHLLTFALGVLVFWLLGFFMTDVASIPGPDFTAVERRHVNPDLYERQKQLQQQTADLDRTLGDARQQQQLVNASSQNLQSTINQILELQRLSIEKQVVQSDADKTTLATSLNSFLENQKKFQEFNQQITDLTSQRQQVEQERTQVAKTIAEQRRPAESEFETLLQSHRIRLAAYQLVILVPLLSLAGYLLVRRRGSVYYPIFFAAGGATLVRVVLVIHEYFPARYFKYILTIALLIVVVRLLVYVIRLLAHPKADSLMRQYREAYERFLCPVCDYPIRVGPRKWLYWTRRTVQKAVPHSGPDSPEEPYTCPSCGSTLFETCPSCQKVRHSMLSHCDHCGAKKGLT